MEIFVIVSVSLWVTSIIGYVIFNLYRKNKKMEDQLLLQQNFIRSFISSSRDIESMVNKIDSTMWVQSDPELLQLFESMKNLNELFKQYRQEND